MRQIVIGDIIDIIEYNRLIMLQNKDLEIQSSREFYKGNFHTLQEEQSFLTDLQIVL